MTISIGFVCKNSIVFACKNSIVFACDSQASFSDTHKHTRADKLDEFAFANGYAVCVMAGGVFFFDAFREIMHRTAAATTIEGERSIPDAANKDRLDGAMFAYQRMQEMILDGGV